MVPSPGKLLKDYVLRYIEVNGLPSHLEDEIPGKWEKYGDFILFDSKSFSSEIWQNQGTGFWIGICDVLKCKRIALKNKIKSDGYRSPNVRVVVGNDPWVICQDNGIKYTWNVENNMFSAGNATERHRIAKLNCRDEVVVDMFAGIGYFVLPFLVHAGARVVHACEWNPDAVTALRRNLKLNHVESKCIIHEGDNRIVCPRGIADRVNLGLIPTSEGSWLNACQALKPKGGILHVHGNVETMTDDVDCPKCADILENVIEASPNVSLSSNGGSYPTTSAMDLKWKRRQWMVWAFHVLHTLLSILRKMDPFRDWICSVKNVHNVKSYAPHVDHIVLDVLLESN